MRTNPKCDACFGSGYEGGSMSAGSCKSCGGSGTELDRERETLRRLERIRRCACEEGAWGTPGLDRDIEETRVVIAELESQAAPRREAPTPHKEKD